MRSASIARRRRDRRARWARRSSPDATTRADRILALSLEIATAAVLVGVIAATLRLGAANVAQYGSWSGTLAIVLFLFWLRCIFGLLAARYFSAETSPFGWGVIAASALTLMLIGYAYAAGGLIHYDPDTGSLTWRLLSDVRPHR